MDHLRWVGLALVEYRPDTVIHLGDHYDLASLNSHEQPGSTFMEGRRYKDDIEAGRAGFKLLAEPMERECRRSRAWKPRKIFLTGNHEDRADRTAANNPKFFGHIGSADCDVRDWEKHPFLKRVWVDGIVLSHYFQNTHSGRPIGGSVDNRLNRIGASFIQGHEQGFKYGNRIMGCGKTMHGLIAGSCYLAPESYRGLQGNDHWVGVCILNEVANGDYCLMNLSLRYLCRKFEHMDLKAYMAKKYPFQTWVGQNERIAA